MLDDVGLVGIMSRIASEAGGGWTWRTAPTQTSILSGATCHDCRWLLSGLLTLQEKDKISLANILQFITKKGKTNKNNTKLNNTNAKDDLRELPKLVFFRKLYQNSKQDEQEGDNGQGPLAAVPVEWRMGVFSCEHYVHYVQNERKTENKWKWSRRGLQIQLKTVGFKMLQQFTDEPTFAITNLRGWEA